VNFFGVSCGELQAGHRGQLIEAGVANVTMVPDAVLTGIEPDGDAGPLRVWLHNEDSGRRWVLAELDTVVLASGGRAVDHLYRALKGRVPELCLVGDAMASRSLHDALLEETRAARRL